MRFINNKHFYFIWVFTSLFTFLHSHPPPVPFCSRRTRPSHRSHFPMNSVFFFISVPLSAISCPLHFYLIFAFCFFCLSFPLSLLHPDSTPPSIHQALFRSLKNHWAANLDPPLQGLIFDSISIIERRSLPFRLMVDWQFSIFQVVFKDSPMKWLETCTHRHPGFQEAKCHYLEFSDGKLTHKLWKMHVRGNNRDKKKMCKWQSRRLKRKTAEMTNTVFAKVDTQLALKVNQSA